MFEGGCVAERGALGDEDIRLRGGREAGRGRRLSG